MTNEQMRRDFVEWKTSQDQAEPEPERTYELSEDGMNELIDSVMFQAWQAATQKANQWMPIADAPKTGEWIIVYDSAGNVHPDYWLGRGMDQWAKDPHDQINTHWQPLPLPPTVAQPQGKPS